MGKTCTVLLIVIFLVAGFHSASGQNTSLYRIPESVSGGIGQTIKIPIEIRNSGDKPQIFVIRVTESDFKSDQKGYFCQNSDCLKNEVQEISRRVEPNTVLEGLSYLIETGLSVGQSQMVFEVYPKANQADASQIPVTILIDEKQPKNVVYRSREILIREVYPNPATSTAYIDYELYAEQKEAKVVIYNILGTSMGEQSLPYNETRAKILTEEFLPGIYFYTIYLNNEGLITRKMVVRR